MSELARTSFEFTVIGVGAACAALGLVAGIWLSDLFAATQQERAGE